MQVIQSADERLRTPAIDARASDFSEAAVPRSREARPVAIWLLICCALLLAMVVVGGVTRLTHSGLSITEWQPIVGSLPPMSDEDWRTTFEKYQATPEYLQINRGMSLAAFKQIFWWEYFHRLLGRAIGVVFLLPYLWFLARRRIPAGYGLPLLGIFILGGLQGVLGWYMVASGLVDDPRVSPLRLTAHLGLAVAIFGAMLWVALSLLRPRAATVNPATAWLRRFAFALCTLVYLMILAGGLVAGTRAGFAYNSFPLMNGHWAPPELFALEPWYLNLVANVATVQFDHRLLAWVLALAIPLFWWRARIMASVTRRAGLAANLLLVMLAVQFTLGVATLLLVVPLPLAAAHQAGAVLLFAAALYSAHSLG
jgi:cytochrome c oxidase assembly protein subunit 15